MVQGEIGPKFSIEKLISENSFRFNDQMTKDTQNNLIKARMCASVNLELRRMTPRE